MRAWRWMKLERINDYVLNRFDTEEVVGTVVNRNRAVCIQPFLMAEGYVIFDVAIGDEKFNWKGKYFVGTYVHWKYLSLKGWDTRSSPVRCWQCLHNLCISLFEHY